MAWVLSQVCESAFATPKTYLIKELILHIADLFKPCSLYCDASLQEIGTILKQRENDSTEHLISDHSRKLLKHEINYAIGELEYLAIVDAVDK